MMYLGVDIGSANVKMIELESYHGKPRLKNYGFAEKAHQATTSTDEMIRQSAEIIQKIYREAGFVSKNVVAALHNFDVFTSVINLPATNVHDLEDVVRVEARKFVPIPLEDVVLDWKVLEKPTSSSAAKKGDEVKSQPPGKGGDAEQEVKEGHEVLLTAAPRKLVKRYVDIFKAAELNILSLETESFAFIRALLDKSESAPLLILDIGAVATDIIIVERQIPVIIRTVEVGGASITETIEQTLGISKERAEQFKRDVGIYSSGSGDEHRSIMQLMESIFVPVVNEINYSLDLYKGRNQTIEKFILSGGSSYLLGLVDFLKERFHIPVYIGDPWHKIEYPVDLKSTLTEIGPMCTVAIGLSLKELLE